MHKTCTQVGTVVLSVQQGHVFYHSADGRNVGVICNFFIIDGDLLGVDTFSLVDVVALSLLS